MIAWKKNKDEDLGGKMKRGKEKRRKNTLTEGEKALKMHHFGLLSQKKIAGGSSDPHPLGS